jgi:hypothetical protein
MENSMAKIRLKFAPKDYKKGPTPTGRARFEQRLLKLLIDLSRFERKATDPADIAWAERARALLREFVNQ